jgi:hypothetical protein
MKFTNEVSEVNTNREKQIAMMIKHGQTPLQNNKMSSLKEFFPDFEDSRRVVNEQTGSRTARRYSGTTTSSR